MTTEMMRAAAFDRFGPPEVLQLTDLPMPQAGPGEVRVRVRAAGVQPFDTAVRSGWTPAGAPEGFPRIPGNEFAGVIDQGDGVGTEVLGFTLMRAYATHVVVPATDVTAKPASMPWEVAGGLTAAVQSAELAVDELAVGAGDTLLVHAAAGAVGGVAVQLAVSRGATVIGTGRPANHDYLRSLGAIPVAYGDGLVERVRELAPGGITAALDGAGGAALDASLDLVKDRDRILTLVEHGKAAELGIRVTQGVRTAERLARHAALYAEGRLKFAIRAAYPLDRAAEAHRDSENGHGQGKIVLTVS
ncbi:NADP-dependent oxidoreductase [Nonomuraea sp. NBC_01738]|uniref:NADP-dependent oxidoreductase n=1 Tax=Nonomuraea sp. NBC_01738 TaxID=2976003 RepID=UPI002E16376A|nr:NADP-dependent oxidoreductase [Nonomuraea sp. NBC_01738]